MNDRSRVGLEGLVDLREWTNPDDDRRGRDAGYAASQRMFAFLAEAVPESTLWRQAWTWEAFDAVLADAGRVGELLRAGLAGGVETQRTLLADRDGDGILGLRERLAGSEPAAWDSDGDGWSDGAPPELVARGVWLPGGAKAVCSGWAAGPLGATIVARGGRAPPEGRAAASDPRVLLDGTEPMDQSFPMPVPAGASIALRPLSGRTQWAIVDGVGLVRDTRCVTVGMWTVFAAPGVDEAAAPFAAALARAARRAEFTLGLDDTARFVWLGAAPRRGGWNDALAVAPGWIDRGAAGQWEYVAAYVVASERVPETALLGAVRGEVELFEAFARTLVDAAPRETIAALDDDAVAAWEARAAACPGGWHAYLAGACGVLEVPDADECEAELDAAAPPPAR